jgi:hypothetical protein
VCVVWENISLKKKMKNYCFASKEYPLYDKNIEKFFYCCLRHQVKTKRVKEKIHTHSNGFTNKCESYLCSFRAIKGKTSTWSVSKNNIYIQFEVMPRQSTLAQISNYTIWKFWGIVSSVTNNSKPDRAQSMFYGPHHGNHRKAQF